MSLRSAARPRLDREGRTVEPPQFARPKFTLQDPELHNHNSLVTLPALVEFNAAYNSKHLFCIQYSHNARSIPRRVTHGELHRAVLRCSVWLAERGLARPPSLISGMIVKARPVALLMTSDVGWLVLFLALLRLGVPVLSMSTRLNPQAVAHLVHQTRTQALLISPQVQGLVDETLSLLEVSPAVHEVPPHGEFMDGNRLIPMSQAPPPSRIRDGNDRNVIILHSSGTTGLPKPIFHSHAYLLGYAACHRLSHADVEGSMNISTLPLYHGFGLLAPCLSLSIGMPFALPAATTVPTGPLVVDILRSSRATSLMTVPSILEELYLLTDGEAVKHLRALRFVAVGGAPMKHNVAQPLADAAVPILNHWGVTEIGAIAPIVIPSADHDWRYLRLREDFNLRIEPIKGENGGYVRLVGCPPGSKEEFVVQDLLEVNPQQPRTEFRIAGRADDLIVLATGEKIRPTLLESTVSENPLVKAALAFGEGRFQLGLIVEAAAHVDLPDAHSVSDYVSQIWPSIEHANCITDTHAQVTRDMIIATSPTTRPLFRTPKGSIPREPNVQLFREEIEEKSNMSRSSHASGSKPLPNEKEFKNIIRAEVWASIGRTARTIGDEDDFFERGMNSLQATILYKRLLTAMSGFAFSSALALPQNIVYTHPTISRLSAALTSSCSSPTVPEVPHKHREVAMEELVAEFEAKMSTSPGLESAARTLHSFGGRRRVLLTGSTGSLGSALLSELVSCPDVEMVYALNRSGTRSLRERQDETLQKLGVVLDDLNWRKVVLLESDLASDHFGLSDEEYDNLCTVSHMIHNGWPMDFNRTLDSFRPQLEVALNVIKLAVDCAIDRPVKVLFSSSIAVVGRHAMIEGAKGAVVEEPQANPHGAEHLGYAEAKWVCERLFESANTMFPDKIASTSVRLGQISGHEVTGSWSTGEHIPMLIKACQATGKIPILPGNASWIPVNRAATAMSEILFAEPPCPAVLHLENPSRQSWPEIMKMMGTNLGIPEESHVPFSEWLQLVKASTDPATNPAIKLIPFLEQSFIRMATGEVALRTAICQNISESLRACQCVSEETMLKYVQYWQAVGFLQ